MELMCNVIPMTRSQEDMKIEFINLINENKVSLYRLAKTILKREQDIEDAISETILKAYDNYGKLRDRESFKGWIFKILVNECYTIIRKDKKYYLHEDLASYDKGYEDDKNDGLMCYVNMLDREFRDVVVLFYYERMIISEIAQVLSIREGTVKSRLSRARNKLKVLMSREEL